MTGFQILSTGLLIGRILTVILMTFVVRKQLRVIHSKRYPELRPIRLLLLSSSAIVILGNIIPIIIDAYGLFGKGSLNLLIAYVISNNITAAVSAFILWYNLRLSEKIKIITDKKLEDK